MLNISDPYMLLSYLNTKLRDQYASLSDLIDDLNLDLDIINSKLQQIGYVYDCNINQYVKKE